jgi:hypothetical protein
MSTPDDQQVSKHRSSPSLPQPPSFTPSPTPQSVFSHVPRFALIRDLATGSRTHAPVTYLFSDEPHPPLPVNDGKTRTLIIDLSPDGEKVEHAQSLSGDWQLVSAKIGTSARVANVESDSSQANTVLNVEGLGQFTPFVRSEDVFDLARQFSERYATLLGSLTIEMT